MISGKKLLEIEVETLFSHVTRSGLDLMIATNEHVPAVAPRFFLGRTFDGVVWRIRQDVDPIIVNRLSELAVSENTEGRFNKPPVHHLEYQELLAVDGGLEIQSGPAYRLNAVGNSKMETIAVGWESADVIEGQFAGLKDKINFDQPCRIVKVDGKVVSICYCERWGDRGAEAGVATLVEHRRNGYATAVVSDWACDVADREKEAFYSTTWKNAPSQEVVRNLSADPYAVLINYL
tara:strand:- start:10567 stop:11271 length:705 start_codon:yes stop_codon:yes gene_type:complete